MGAITKSLARIAESQPPSVLLDPFAGTGTTAITALQHGCHFIGCEEDPICHKLASKRINAFNMDNLGCELFHAKKYIKETKEAEVPKVCFLDLVSAFINLFNVCIICHSRLFVPR